MSDVHVVETREYRDGDKLLIASVLDNGCVAFTSEGAGVSVVVLQQLIDLARAAFDARNDAEEACLNASHLDPTAKP